MFIENPRAIKKTKAVGQIRRHTMLLFILLQTSELLEENQALPSLINQARLADRQQINWSNQIF